MRRTLAISTLVALSLAACGGSDESTAVSLPPTDDTETTDVGTTESDDGSGDETATTDGETEPDAGETDDGCIPEGGDAPEGSQNPDPSADKPEVELPDAEPTELVRTVVEEGQGEAAEDGDTVIVDYVGVRSDDGLEFDNSYDRGQPFPVTLGQGAVIQGWDEGLLGARTGERVQLDIPSEQAYGDTGRSEVICANEDLSFVIDVRAVVKSADPDDAPSEPGVELSEDPGVDTTEFETLEAGDGEVIETGDTAIIRYVNFRGDNGVAIESNWADEPLQVVYGDNLLPGLITGLEGMAVGERRAVTIPPEEGFGPDGNPQGGLPAGTDMIFVIDLIGVY